jgi:FixJ family two-component response regulator
MADGSVELTEGQKACLRLVDDHLTSKEIGRSLGISHFTVDQGWTRRGATERRNAQRCRENFCGY